MKDFVLAGSLLLNLLTIFGMQKSHLRSGWHGHSRCVRDNLRDLPPEWAVTVCDGDAAFEEWIAREREKY